MTTVAPNVLIAENDDVCRLFLADNLEAAQLAARARIAAAPTQMALGLDLD